MNYNYSIKILQLIVNDQEFQTVCDQGWTSSSVQGVTPWRREGSSPLIFSWGNIGVGVPREQRISDLDKHIDSFNHNLN